MTDPFHPNADDPSPTDRMPVPGGAEAMTPTDGPPAGDQPPPPPTTSAALDTTSATGAGSPAPAPSPSDAAASPTSGPSSPSGPSPASPASPASAPVPAWRPTRRNDSRTASAIIGLILLAIGLWFFAGQTLGLDLPSIRWSQLWPLILIGIGLWIVLGTRRARP